MTTATKILRNRIVLVFDFDDTLGPSTTRTLFEYLDLNYKDFQEEVERRRDEDMWQFALAKAEMLRVYSHQEDKPIRRKAMLELAASYPLFQGASDFITRLKQYAGGKDEKITLEFVMLTAGFKTIPEHTDIAKGFDRIYGGELVFDDEGRILGAKRIITHEDKVHYIKQLKEGIEFSKPSDLENTYLHHDTQEDYVPMSQVVYVGDGSSDMSAFQIVEEGGGIAIAIDPDGDGNWAGYDQMAPGRRVHNVCRGDYREGDELFESLKLSVDRMVAEIQLLRFGKGE